MNCLKSGEDTCNDHEQTFYVVFFSCDSCETKLKAATCQGWSKSCSRWLFMLNFMFMFFGHHASPGIFSWTHSWYINHFKFYFYLEYFQKRNTDAKIIFTSSYIFRLCHKGGDAGTTSNSAEVHGLGRKLLIYSNVLPGYQDYTTDGHLQLENKAKALSDHVTICISHERVEVTNYCGYQAVITTANISLS